MTLVSTLALSSSRNKFLPNKKKMMCLTSEDAVYTGNDLGFWLTFHNEKHVVTAASLEASLLPVAFSLSLSLDCSALGVSSKSRSEAFAVHPLGGKKTSEGLDGHWGVQLFSVPRWNFVPQR